MASSVGTLRRLRECDVARGRVVDAVARLAVRVVLGPVAPAVGLLVAAPSAGSPRARSSARTGRCPRRSPESSARTPELRQARKPRSDARDRRTRHCQFARPCMPAPCPAAVRSPAFDAATDPALLSRSAMFTGLVETKGTLDRRTAARAARRAARRPRRARDRGAARARRVDRGRRRVPHGGRDRRARRPGARRLRGRRLRRDARRRRRSATSRPARTSTSSAPSPLGGRLGGHIVSGHVDGVGRIADEDPVGGARRRSPSQAPAELARYIAPKGSICVSGVSLTVNNVDGRSRFDVVLVPHTRDKTSLDALARGRTREPRGRPPRPLRRSPPRMRSAPPPASPRPCVLGRRAGPTAFSAPVTCRRYTCPPR